MMQTDGDHVLTSEAEFFLDTAVPNMSRIFDYLLGGTTNFEADREAADALLKQIPSLRKWTRLHRAFVQEATFTLYNENFTQFLDLGSGMPGEHQPHHAIPNARIVYSDINPVAVSYGQSLYAEFMNIDYIYGNIKQIENILTATAVRRLIDLREKVAIGLNALILYLDENENHKLAQALYDWAPPGSKIFVVFQTRAQQTMTEAYKLLLSTSAAANMPLRLHTLDQCIAMMAPWQIRRLQPLTEFLGLPDDFITENDRAGIGVTFYAAFLTK
jgi:hypothetical protein